METCVSKIGHPIRYSRRIQCGSAATTENPGIPWAFDVPEADAASFTAGWLRTGDGGYLDGDGYLFLTGRLKEQINRGGEKVSPVEVDEVLLRYPGVAEAVTFAIPHDKLGEEVGAAVVLREGHEIDVRVLRSYVSEHLAAFKVPRIIFVDELPKSATGKLKRIGLAERLGLAD